MTKKSKSTKQIRAIDRIIKFQIDDGIESLTISGKEALADVSIDSKANVTLYLNADKDKLNEIKSLVPFITLETKAGGTDPNKTKAVELSQDLTQFALEVADNSKELATLIKTQSSIVLDLDGLVQKLLEIAGKLVELEQKDQEQDNRLTALETKDQEQDNKLATLETEQAEHASKLVSLEEKNTEQDNTLEENLAFMKQYIDNNIGGGFEKNIITTIQPYFEEATLTTAERFDAVHYDKCAIGSNRAIRNGIVFITIHRFLGDSVDGRGIITAMFQAYDVSNADLHQEHVLEMKTISSGVIKIRCELININGHGPEFKVYDIPNESLENYKISIRGFNFVPMTVLAPVNDVIYG